MESIKQKYPGIENPIILALLELLPQQQEFLEEERRKRVQEMEFQDKVFGNVVRQLSQLPPFKELAQKAAAKTS